MNAICPFCGATLDEEQQCKKPECAAMRAGARRRMIPSTSTGKPRIPRSTTPPSSRRQIGEEKKPESEEKKE